MINPAVISIIFFVAGPKPLEFYTLSLHDALPICAVADRTYRVEFTPQLSAPDWRDISGPIVAPGASASWSGAATNGARSEEHTSELQSPYDLVCRLLLEKQMASIRPVRVNLSAYL